MPMKDRYEWSLQSQFEEVKQRAGITADPGQFRRYGSERKLYNFNVDHADAY